MLAAFAELARSAGLGPVADLGCGTSRIAAYLHALGVDGMSLIAAKPAISVS